MRNPKTFSRRGWMAVALLAGTALACSNQDLQPAVDPPSGTIDNLLEVSGTLCTNSEPVVFPLKILLIVDNSGSLQCTDDGQLRVQAVQDVVNRFSGRAGVEMGIIAFNESIDSSWDPAGGCPDPFVPDAATDTACFQPVVAGLTTADGPTSYQGALAYAYGMLLADMLPPMGTSYNSELPRSKYVIIFFSDGTPDPQCSADPAVMDFLFCDTARMDWQMIGLDPADTMLWYGFAGTGDYNQPYQILSLVRDILDLKDIFGVGDMRFHTAYLHPPLGFTNPVCPPNWDQIFGVDPVAAVALLSDMANEGNGTYTDYYMAQAISFLSYDFTSIDRPFVMANLMAHNKNAIPALDHFAVDSDGDGFGDEAEFAEYTSRTMLPVLNGMNPDPRVLEDWDGDGYRDRFELDNVDRGFDPYDNMRPAIPCALSWVGGLGLEDWDFDGLRNCEENVIGSSADQADSDRDRIDDAIEALFGTDPILNDVTGDIDGDGILNREEILFHSDPWAIDPGVYEGLRYWYETIDLGRDASGQNCYDYVVRNISLVTPLPLVPGGLGGVNDVLIYVNEAPNGDALDWGKIRVACARVRYVAPAFKDPADGTFELFDESFVPLDQFDIASTTPCSLRSTPDQVCGCELPE